MIRHLTLCFLMLASTGVLVAEEKPSAVAEVRLTTDQWCWTHDLPKDICATCDRKLIPALKKAKDWCAEHDKAESVCEICDPTTKTRLDALRPTEKPKDTK